MVRHFLARDFKWEPTTCFHGEIRIFFLSKKHLNQCCGEGTDQPFCLIHGILLTDQILLVCRSDCMYVQAWLAHCGPKIIAPDKAFFFSNQKLLIFFFYFSTKTYLVGTHQKRLNEALLMSTHKIHFDGEIRKIFCGYSILSGAME